MERQNTKLEEDNNILRGVVTSMQKCLNKLDSDERNKNIIISGVPETNITVDDNTLTNVRILYLTENAYLDMNTIKNLKIFRLGKERRGYNRFIKIVLSSVNDRDEFIKNTEKLKASPEPWNKVFIKKDQHPVYLSEYNRLRKKAYDLKKTAGNENKEIKIIKGELFVDNITVDKNLFFH